LVKVILAKRENIVMKSGIIFCFILILISCSASPKKEELAIELNNKAVELYHKNENDSLTISKVIDLYNLAIDADSTYLIPFWNKITLFCEQKRCHEDLTELEEFQKNNKRVPGILSSTGFILEGFGLREEAQNKYVQELALYDSLIQITNDSMLADMKVSRAFILIFVKGKSDGIVEFDKIASENPLDELIQSQKMIFYDFDRDSFIEEYCNCDRK